MLSPTLISHHVLTIEIGEIPIRVHTDSREFAQMLEERYGEFVTAQAPLALMEIEIELVKEPGRELRDSGLGKDDDADADVSVRREAGRWIMTRGDFRAEWDSESNRGWVRQRPNPYAIDGVLRILHSLIMARAGGFLLHAASAVRNGRAFVFAGVSGAGKTTLARLAPPDVTLLTDEISYVRPQGQVSGARRQVPGGSGEELEVRSQESGAKRQGESQISNHKSQIANPQSQTAHPESRTPNPEFRLPCSESLTPDTRHLTPAFSAFGTPFAGELARIGKKVQAPLAAVFLLEQGPENRIEPLGEPEAARDLLRHVLFFARDEELVRMVFQTVCDFVRRVPVRRLVFTKDARVWELIQ